MKSQSSKTMLDPSTELKLMASLSFVETVDLSDEVSNRMTDAWLELRKKEGSKADYAALSDRLRPQIRQQVLLEMIAAKEGGKNGG